MRFSLIATQRTLERWSCVFSLIVLILVFKRYWKMRSITEHMLCATKTTVIVCKEAAPINPVNTDELEISRTVDLQSSTSVIRTSTVQPSKTALTEKRRERRTIYVITATYRRPQQMAELTRLAQTLMHVPDLVWLVVEDAQNANDQVQDLLRRTGIDHTYLLAPMPKEFSRDKYDFTHLPRGVSNRNRGLEWLRENASEGVFYFADDDNTYDIRLFEEMRPTRVISLWPVGLLSGGFSSPIVRDGRFIGFYTGWNGRRVWQVDMAGFAVSIELLSKRTKAKMPYIAGYEEDGFLRSLYPIKRKEIELKAKNCTEILVWHTQTKTPPPQRELKGPRLAYEGTNILKLYDSLT